MIDNTTDPSQRTEREWIDAAKADLIEAAKAKVAARRGEWLPVPDMRYPTRILDKAAAELRAEKRCTS